MERTKTHPLNRLFTVTGPSGAGKDTLMHTVANIDARIRFFATATTRAPRAGEVDGVDYHFMDAALFQEKIKNGEVLEWSHHYNNYYGTLRSVVEKGLNEGHDLITDITWSGVSALARAFPDHIFKILILPPSVEALTERFMLRQKKSAETEEAIRNRLEKIQTDMNHIHEPGYIFINDDMKGSTLEDYDLVVYNEDLAKAVEAFHNGVRAARAQVR